MAKFLKVTHADGLSGFINVDLVTEVRKVTTEELVLSDLFRWKPRGSTS